MIESSDQPEPLSRQPDADWSSDATSESADPTAHTDDIESLSDADPRDLRLAEIISNVGDAVTRGEIIDLEQICRANADLADELRRLWGTILVTDTAGAVADEGLPAEPSGEEPSRWRSIQLPTTIDDYELIEELGRGGMGVVYRARQISLSREVAIKMILRGRLASPSDLQRFLAEASATAQLEHPNIVPVFEVGDFDGRPFFSMQLIEGRTLMDKAKGNPLPQRRAARIVSTVARAIAFAHRQGVLHRDLKPSNILLTKAGTPMVTDFGLAKQDAFAAARGAARTGIGGDPLRPAVVIDDIPPTRATTDQRQLAAAADNQEVASGDDSAVVTRSGMLIGTPAYMSPEQAGSQRLSIGPASDVYSLGCVLYFALTGRSPFIADSAVEMVMQVIEQEPTSPRVLRPSLNRDLEGIVIRCLQKPIDLRYETADALADDLDAFLSDEKVLARSGHFNQVLARLFRETHHAAILEKWGLLWMWHSLVLLVACILTWSLDYSGVKSRLVYAALWTVGLGAWAAVFWKLRQRMGPVTFIERQIAHVWGASMIAIGLLFPLEYWLGLPVLTLSPLLGIISAMVFIIKAGMLSGAFYIQAGALFLAAIGMAVFPSAAHLIFGLVAAGCFFMPGYQYARRRRYATLV